MYIYSIYLATQISLYAANKSMTSMFEYNVSHITVSRNPLFNRDIFIVTDLRGPGGFVKKQFGELKNTDFVRV